VKKEFQSGQGELVTVDHPEGQLLDPELGQLIESFAYLEYSDETLQQMREMLPVAPATSPSGVEREDRVISGEPEVVVRTHRPTNPTGSAPAVLSMHGGGYIIGNRSIDDARLAHWCTKFGVVGVSVEYRLSPETTYPGPLEDCYLALHWLFEHADELGVDRRRVGVTGVSAGGGLAAGLALLVRDRGEGEIAFQLLDCPMLDDRQSMPSRQRAGMPMWSREANDFGWRNYLGGLYGTADVPAYAAPFRTDDLAGLPPAYVSVGALDGFLDEDVAYATRLNAAGVPAELHVYPHAPHGFQLFSGAALADRANRHMDEWLAAQLAR
jgi:acetyl esterase/lipase